MNILFINNYDSFVYNLVNYICQLLPEANILVEDNNISIQTAKEYCPNKIIVICQEIVIIYATLTL